VAGIQAWEYVGGATPKYDEGRRLYTAEINAAVRGCKAAGSTEIVAIDGHGGGYPNCKPFMSWIGDQLEPGAEYVVGHPWCRYTAPFETGCDCVLFVGAHAKAGTPNGVLSHTVSSEAWYNASVLPGPGRPEPVYLGESGIVASIAGSFGVPCVYVSGDAATCREVRDLLGPGVVEAAVKTGLGRYSARNLAPADACVLIERTVAAALLARSTWPAPLVFEPPVTFRVEVATPDRVREFEGRTGVEIVGDRTVQATGSTFWEAWDAIWYRT
jgi:D-amino peptidase